ncbi:hypothetical protein [Lacrimispora sp.]
MADMVYASHKWLCSSLSKKAQREILGYSGKGYGTSAVKQGE